jgi:hypothetical protein
MKHPAFLAAVVVGISLIVCTAIVGSSVRAFGRSMERVAKSQRHSSFPSNITLRTPDLGQINFRLSNGGGGGESFRVESVTKGGG